METTQPLRLLCARARTVPHLTLGLVHESLALRVSFPKALVSMGREGRTSYRISLKVEFQNWQGLGFEGPPHLSLLQWQGPGFEVPISGAWLLLLVGRDGFQSSQKHVGLASCGHAHTPSYLGEAKRDQHQAICRSAGLHALHPVQKQRPSENMSQSKWASNDSPPSVYSPIWSSTGWPIAHPVQGHQDPPPAAHRPSSEGEGC